MEDSGLWYYILLGAIYILSKMFGKKKKPQDQAPIDLPDLQPGESNTPPRKKNQPSSFEELLRELTEEINPQEPEPIPEPPKPIQKEPVLATQVVNYQKTNIEEVKPNEKIDIPGHKPIERKKPVYERSENYAIEEEHNEVKEGVQELLDSHSGLQQAFVLKEVLDRKY